MIPKIIHVCWLSGESFPPVILDCLDSWSKYLSDYDLYFWGKFPPHFDDYKERFKSVRLCNFDISSTLWTKEAFETKKYAFAADYIRLYAVYHYGGIYLDSDVIMYKSFDSLLSLSYFIGQDHEGGFEPAIFGAEKGCPWIKSILSHYDNRHFLLSDGEFDMNPLPRIFYNILVPRYNMIRTIGNKAYDDMDKNFFIFPTDYFNSRDSIEVSPTYNSFCAHNYAGSWTKKDNSIKGLIINVLPKSFVKLYFMISHNLWNKSKYRLNINNNIK